MTDQGKSYVREHESDFDAQSVYRKLLDYANKSTAADIAKEQLVDYLTTKKLDSRWTGTTEGFILLWREQLRLLEDMTPVEQHYDPLVKKCMLVSAVKGIPELANVKNIENNLIAAGNAPLDYEQYGTLLMSAAMQRDNNIKLPGSRNKCIVQMAKGSYRIDREVDFL